MKRIIFSALVAIVAVGGAFAGNVSTSRFIEPVTGASGTTINQPNPTCTNLLTPCNRISGATCLVSGTVQFAPNQAGLCVVELFRDSAN